MSTLKSVATSRFVRVGAIAAVASATLVGVGATASQATTPAPLTYVAAPKTGPGATAGAVISIVGSGFLTAAGSSLLNAGGGTAGKAVQFTSTTCATTYSAPSAGTFATAISIPTAAKIVVTVPSLALGSSSAPLAYKVCVFGSANTGALLGSAPYTVYPAPTITGANVPAKGPAFGGNSVVVTGTNFTAASAVKFGSIASPKVTVAKDGLSLVAVAPAQTGALAVSVTTEGGANAAPSTGTWDDYTYTNALTVAPSAVVHGVLSTLDITGLGFSALTSWSAAVSSIAPASSAVAHVYLVKGLYDSTDNSGAKTNPESLECVNVQVVSNTEITCDMTTSTRTSDDGAYSVEIVDDGTRAVAPTFQTVVSSGATLTIADF